ncbi:MAG: 3-dehydroquinate synthase [Candidatus Omnitrophica bacterium]|nr:3-dehydroquinate synthase [Candidatus Omnitrophota bacterium]
MVKTIDLNLDRNPYKILVGYDSLKDFGKHASQFKLSPHGIIITNPLIKRLYAGPLVKSLESQNFQMKILTVPDGEKSKSAAEAFKLMGKVAAYDIMRKPFIIALGGGVIGDLAGFIAATYRRGVPYFQVPTTLLAQVDSAIGGKTAIDLPVGKNLVGAFYQPKSVWSDTSVLKSLSKRQIRNGLAEVIKYGIIYDALFFRFLENNTQKILQMDKAAISKVVQRCSQIKAEVVLADEFETKDIRSILNFGHTVGHAIEACGKFKLYQHGEAIALGMRIATDISHQLKMLKSGDVERINGLITKIGLPRKIKSLKVSRILQLMNHDKKFESGQNKFVLARSIGKVVVKRNVPMDIIKNAVERFI